MCTGPRVSQAYSLAFGLGALSGSCVSLLLVGFVFKSLREIAVPQRENPAERLPEVEGVSQQHPGKTRQTSRLRTKTTPKNKRALALGPFWDHFGIRRRGPNRPKIAPGAEKVHPETSREPNFCSISASKAACIDFVFNFCPNLHEISMTFCNVIEPQNVETQNRK